MEIQPSDVTISPMFPLGTVLFPGESIPLHIFEERYRQLTADCLAADGRFGIVLIERGSEVGGGETRVDSGTLVEITGARETPDGRWALLVTGVQRIKVARWLADDPYPLAEIEPWDDGESAETWAEAAGTPLGAFDRQRVLAASSPAARRALLDALQDERDELRRGLDGD